ncbi:Signal recognition particle [Mycoemilia scoparia]|uniref:Signal recognition particle 54 kDa protein n=1 Tax=Mycoemilia scoparia TaxID=417184 RepID=A0A9W8DRE5_9FUNG|nr:Signal recognition particle [Mycoemilia scoparia]
MVLNELGSRINTALQNLSKEAAIDSKAVDALLMEICKALLESDINVKLVHQLRTNVKKSIDLDQLASSANKRRVIQNAVFEELCNLVDPGVEQWKPKKGKSNVIMFVGLQGNGKTTTCTKLAAHYHRKGWKTGLVCADTFRAGAFDQIRQNSSKAHIPYYGRQVYSEVDPVKVASEGVKKFKKDKYEIIIVDTSGRHKQETELFKEMEEISAGVNPDNVVFVMDGTIGQAADAQARAFKESVDIGSIIITKMDGHAKGGGAISAVAATKSPIVFIGTGEHIYDLERFAPRPFVSKMLGMGDIGGLVETVRDMQLDKTHKNMFKNISQGVFTLRDMRDQLQTISKMGPLNKLMGMMPGMPPELANSFSAEDSSRKIRQSMSIFDSMTEQELDSDGKIFETQKSRLDRISRGSGVRPFEIHALLHQHKQFAQMVKKMGGNKGLLKNMNPEMMRRAAAGGGMPNPGSMNPSQLARMQQQMSKMINPQALQSMGGMGGLQDMMQQMMGGGGPGGGMGGMGGLQNMMQQMMGGGGGLGGMQEMMQQMMGGGGAGRGRGRR